MVTQLRTPWLVKVPIPRADVRLAMVCIGAK